MLTPQYRLLMDDEIIVDLFAGGGGMSVAIEDALGRSPDIAINHNDDALSMHRANHPQTRHFVADVFEVCPHAATQGRPVGLLHLSPDCTHHSQAAGGQPRDSRIRALSWVGKRWAGQKAPRVITLENVSQILKWGPLVAKRCKATGRVVKRDATAEAGWSVAGPGERVPVQDQYLVPCPRRAGRTWRRFVRDLELLGYDVDWFNMVASDYGANTSRDRLFMVARRDGKPIVRPEPSHHKNPDKGQHRWRPAHEVIDWTIPCQSIFTRQKPLADATLRRIARGVVRYVLQNGDPFIVPVTHHGGDRIHAIDEPLRTVTAAHRGEFALCAPTLIEAAHGEGRPGGRQRWGDGVRSLSDPLGTILAGGGKYAIAAPILAKFRGTSDGSPIDEPVPTITSGAGAKRPAGAAHALGLVTAFLEQANTGMVGHDARDPVSTIVGKGSTQRLVTAHLATLRLNCIGRGADEPLPTLTAGAEHHALVECTLSPENEAGALRTAAFLMRYYGEGGQWGDLRDPMATITTRDRLALVTVTIQGTPYVIVDIGLRMLAPRELYLAQGFPANYIIDRGHDGRRFSKSAQVRMCGNSVSRHPARALISANVPELAVRRIAA